jgi:Arc/MetJ-type ribon-helix-helix transcriptional regulator
MARVSKITISLPAAQAAFLERLQALTGTSRSELIARAIREMEIRERESRYEKAYSRSLETDEETAFTDAAAEDFFSEPQTIQANPVVKATSRRAAAPHVRAATARSRTASTTARKKAGGRAAR